MVLIKKLMATASFDLPLIGMFATVRNRLGVVVAVSSHDAREGGRTHLVNIEYKDDLLPHGERLVWELEPYAICQHPSRLPDTGQAPMDTQDFDAVVRSARWTATSSSRIDRNGSGIFSGDSHRG